MSTLSPAEIRAAARKRSALDHPGTIRSVYPFWDAQYRPYLLMAVDRLPREHFDWSPAPDMLTAHQTILHIAEAQKSWNCVIEGVEPIEWVVERTKPAVGFETTIDVPDHEALHALLAEHHKPFQAMFERPLSELGRVVRFTLPEGEQRTYTLHWILDHVQEHEIHHRAQLNLYLRMLGIEPPSI